MTDLTRPPSAKLVTRPGYEGDWWACYNCEAPLYPADPTFWASRNLGAAAATKRVLAEIAGIDTEGLERADVQHKCGRCGRIQALGPGVIPFSAASGTKMPLPKNIDPKKLAEMQQSYDHLKRQQRGRVPSQMAVIRHSGYARNTVREYWSFISE